MQVLASSKSVIPAAAQRCLTTVRRVAYISVRPAFVDSAFDAMAGSVNDLKALGESATPTRRAEGRCIDGLCTLGASSADSEI